MCYKMYMNTSSGHFIKKLHTLDKITGKPVNGIDNKMVPAHKFVFPKTEFMI